MVYFVGAGPGAADLITLRGARLLERADVVVYAGSLVNPELLELCPHGCICHDSSRMTLEQIVAVMSAAHRKGETCVRLHTGDPALYGAHGEQMAELDRLGVPYEVVPGVSSLFGAAATLQCELTVPEVTQSVIITRAPGRTPVPHKESLSSMAAHGSTMVFFLSAAQLATVERELLEGGYAPHTPAAVVVRATWPDEAVYRCTVGTLAACAKEHGVARTALVVVGECLAAHDTRSHLYDQGFSHGYREALRTTRGEERHAN